MTVGPQGGLVFESKGEFRRYVRDNIHRIVPLNDLETVLDMLQGKVAGLADGRMGDPERLLGAAHRMGEARDLLGRSLGHGYSTPPLHLRHHLCKFGKAVGELADGRVRGDA